METSVISRGSPSCDGLPTGKKCCDVPFTLEGLNDEEVCYYTTEVVNKNAFTDLDTTLTLDLVDDDATTGTSVTRNTDQIGNKLPVIVVEQTALDVGRLFEPGGTQLYRLTVTNSDDSASTDPLTLDEVKSVLTLTKFGELTDTGVEVDVSKNGGLISRTSCDDLVGTVILPQREYSCTFRVDQAGNSGDNFRLSTTVWGHDDDGATDAGGLVRVEDTDSSISQMGNIPPVIGVTLTPEVPSVPENGRLVKFSVTIQNQSPGTDSVTITSLRGITSPSQLNIGGTVTRGVPVPFDIDQVTDGIVGSTNCEKPHTILPGATYECEYTAFVIGGAGAERDTRLVVTGIDDDGFSAVGEDKAKVSITNLPSDIQIIQTPNVTDIIEGEVPILYTYEIFNPSEVEDLLITGLIDSEAGDLNGQGNCSFSDPGVRVPPKPLNGQSSYICAVERIVSASPDEDVENTIRAIAIDEDTGEPLFATDGDIITVHDISTTPDAYITPLPGELDEPGGIVTYNITIVNRSPVDSQDVVNIITTQQPDIFSSGLHCVPPGTLAPLESWTCLFDVVVDGNAGDEYINDLEVMTTDDDGKDYVVTDDSKVVILDVLPEITVDLEPSTTEPPQTEDGTNVTFKVVIRNEKDSEELTLTELGDDKWGDLDKNAPNPAWEDSTCDSSAVVPAGGNYTCEYTVKIIGFSGEERDNVVKAVAGDDDGNKAVGERGGRLIILPPLCLALNFGGCTRRGQWCCDGLKCFANGSGGSICAAEGPSSAVSVHHLSEGGLLDSVDVEEGRRRLMRVDDMVADLDLNLIGRRACAAAWERNVTTSWTRVQLGQERAVGGGQRGVSRRSGRLLSAADVDSTGELVLEGTEADMARAPTSRRLMAGRPESTTHCEWSYNTNSTMTAAQQAAIAIDDFLCWHNIRKLMVDSEARPNNVIVSTLNFTQNTEARPKSFDMSSVGLLDDPEPNVLLGAVETEEAIPREKPFLWFIIFFVSLFSILCLCWCVGLLAMTRGEDDDESEEEEEEEILKPEKERPAWWPFQKVEAVDNPVYARRAGGAQRRGSFRRGSSSMERSTSRGTTGGRQTASASPYRRTAEGRRVSASSYTPRGRSSMGVVGANLEFGINTKKDKAKSKKKKDTTPPLSPRNPMFESAAAAGGRPAALPNLDQLDFDNSHAHDSSSDESDGGAGGTGNWHEFIKWN
ncbi:unnamed protein product [Chrysoparadoxa australica]